ncbi:helix-turn-helix transcriptional regulator [Rhodococcus sovatensis]|uniref:LuxR C-terminal-related transcriptional regulator n=1 Tax=Rhodococcus sovatensis TaxID=1805840 RepID=A0ABZ2PF98_9NOCA
MPPHSRTTGATDLWNELAQVLYMRGYVPGPIRNRPDEKLTPFYGVVALLNRLENPIVLVLHDRMDAPISDNFTHEEITQLLGLCQDVDIVLITASRNWLGKVAQTGFSYEVIDEQDLVFSVDDTKRALRARNIDHSHDDAEVARKVTLGIPSLMKFATNAFRAMVTTAPRGDHYLRTVSRSLDVYVEARIYRDDRISHLHGFIDAIAAAESIDADLAYALSRRPGTDAALAELHARGLLMIDKSTAESGRWMFAPALREAILKRQRDENNDPTPRLIYVARWHYDNGSYRDALRHAMQAQDWTLTMDIIEAQWVVLFSHDVSTLRAALRALPVDRLSGRPLLSAGRKLLTGVDALPVKTPFVLPATVDRLHTLAASRGAHETLVAGTVHSVLARMSGDYAAAEVLTRRLSILCRLMLDLAPDTEIDALGLLRYQWSINFQLAGQLHDSSIEAALAYRDSGSDALNMVARGSAGTSALNWALIGEHHRAQEWLVRKRLHPFTHGWLEPVIRTSGLAARGLIALDALDLERAEYTEAQLSTVGSRDELWPLVSYVRSNYALLQGIPAPALDQLRRHNMNRPSDTEKPSLVRWLLTAVEIDLLLACGWGNHADAVAARAGSDDWATVARARVYGLTGRHTQAISTARTLSNAASVPPRLLVDALLIEASSQLCLHDEAAAVSAWTRATSLVDHMKLHRSLAYMPRSDIETLERLAPKQSAAARYVLSLGLQPVFRVPITFVVLTERERAVLHALAAGLGHNHIAQELFVSTNTVKSQLRSVYKKLKAHTRDEALSAARDMGLLA